jgi:hypothetical protein
MAGTANVITVDVKGVINDAMDVVSKINFLFRLGFLLNITKTLMVYRK